MNESHTIISIGECAFRDCSGLNKITILNSDCDITNISDTVPDMATIYGYLGSTAETYAKTYNRTFIALDSDNGTDSDDTTGDDNDGNTTNIPPVKYLVSFDANGGGTSQSSITVIKGTAYGTLPTAERTGYTFEGWYTEKRGGSKVTSTTNANISAAQTLYAHWTGNKYTVIFDVNGGKALASGKKTKQVTYGDAYGTLVTPTRKGYTFAGWYTTKKSSGSQITKTSKVQTAKDQMLYARWEKVSVSTAKKPILKSTKKKQLKVTFKKVSAAKGYQIRYSTSAKFTRKTTHTVSQTKLSRTITKLKSGEKYYVQVRAYKLDSTKQKVYGRWSKTASETIK